MFTVKNYLNYAGVCALLGAASMFTSCDSFYEDLAPCDTPPRHGIRFVFTNNIVGADAFSTQVRSVAVYGFDSNDKLAFYIHEKGDALAMQGYTLPLEEKLEPGNYTLVAWCGLENEGTRSESFTISDNEIGVTTRQELLCRMEREVRIDGTSHSSQDLYDLFHGTAYIEVYDEDEFKNGEDEVYTISLTKDTNRVKIILQSLSGEDLDVNDFYYTIEDSNGLLSSENDLEDDDEIVYHPYNRENGTATIDLDPQTRAAVVNNTIPMVDITMSRLMARRQSWMTIQDKTNDNNTILRIPLTDYATLVKGNYNRIMTDQEYLDAQDNYVLMFFLDKDRSWLSTRIVVNSWTVYTQPADLGTPEQ